MTTANNNRYGSKQIDLIALEATAEEYVMYYLNTEFPGVNVKSINLTLTSVQSTPESLNRSTVVR